MVGYALYLPAYPIGNLVQYQVEEHLSKCATAEDWAREYIKSLLSISSSPANGVCFCAGSFSARKDNDVVEMFKMCASHVGFLHLRSTQVLENGDFFEAPHLEGRVDMYELVKAICAEQIRRKAENREDWRIPFRPDHGSDIMDDLLKQPNPNPGYGGLGRMRGLAALRGLEMGIMRSLFPETAF